MSMIKIYNCDCCGIEIEEKDIICPIAGTQNVHVRWISLIPKTKIDDWMRDVQHVCPTCADILKLALREQIAKIRSSVPDVRETY
jgi:formate-dependent nitrite reductase cytochrome c552 subunit